MNDFKWYGEDADSVIIPRVDAVAVYRNPNGDIVIRQENAVDGEDNIVIVPRMHAQSIVDAIQRHMQDE